MQLESKTFNIGKVFNSLKDNKFYIICVIFLILGMLFGALSVRYMGSNYISVIEKWFSVYISFRTQKGFVEIFFRVFLSSTLYIAVISVLAFGVGGVVLLPIVMLFRGFGTCAISGILYRNFSLQGIAFSNLILLPFCIAVDFLLLYICSEALKLSWRFIDVLRDVSSRGIAIRPNCVLLLKKCLFCLLAVVVVSVIESVFSVSFVKFFVF